MVGDLSVQGNKTGSGLERTTKWLKRESVGNVLEDEA